MKKVMIGYMQNKKHDHFDTPAYAVKPLLPYIKPEWTVWEPTDTTGKSQIARVLRKHGCKVVSTSKKKFDFLKDEPDFDFDCIVTNPPYAIKNDFIQRCYKYKERWAMLMPLTALEGVERGQWYDDFGIQLLVLDRRVEFTSGSVRFNSSWFCNGILPQQLMFAQLEKE